MLSYAACELAGQLAELTTRASTPNIRRHLSVVMQQLRAMQHWAHRLETGGPKVVASVAASIARTARQGRRVLIPTALIFRGGGHATLVECIPAAQNAYTVRVYNTGMGAEGKHHSLPEGDKRQSYVEVRGVPAAVVQTPESIERLLKLGYGAPGYSKSVGDVLTRLYAWAEDVGCVAPPAGSYHAPQSIGTCAWKCITSYLKEALPANTYFDFKLHYQQAIVQQFSAALQPAPALMGVQGPAYGCCYAPMMGVWAITPVGMAAIPTAWAWGIDFQSAALLQTASLKIVKTFKRWLAAQGLPMGPRGPHTDAPKISMP